VASGGGAAVEVSCAVNRQAGIGSVAVGNGAEVVNRRVCLRLRRRRYSDGQCEDCEYGQGRAATDSQAAALLSLPPRHDDSPFPPTPIAKLYALLSNPTLWE